MLHCNGIPAGLFDASKAKSRGTYVSRHSHTVPCDRCLQVAAHDLACENSDGRKTEGNRVLLRPRTWGSRRALDFAICGLREDCSTRFGRSPVFARPRPEHGAAPFESRRRCSYRPAICVCLSRSPCNLCPVTSGIGCAPCLTAVGTSFDSPRLRPQPSSCLPLRTQGRGSQCAS
jgi:hypothetical protein